jgi:hypothetical protein
VAPSIHRLRDLDRCGRVWAGLFAVGLLLAPVLAFAWAAPDWAPEGDPALMAVRALDVGTSRTPLVGQPSTSGLYGGDAGGRHVAHPGPLHFYLMALPVRLAGPALGMLAVSLLVTGGAVLVAAWATFRQLGPLGGALGAVALSLVTFTTGASSLVNPVSSNIAGYPVLCSLVLLWCLVCGDLRLLPLAVGVVSFAAQQHLSSLPVLVVVTVATVLAALVGARTGRPRRGERSRRRPRPRWAAGADSKFPRVGRGVRANPLGLLVGWWRAQGWRDASARRELRTWAGWSAVVGLVLWSPVLVQQVTGHPGNLSAMVRFAGNSDRPSLGTGAAVRQLAHTLGLPPMLGRTRLHGGWLLADVGPLTWASAVVVAGVVAVAGVRWRREHPRRAALALVAGCVAVGGLVNGASVPSGIEQYRLAFYHWAFALAFLVTLTVGLAAADGLRWVAGRWAAGRPPRWTGPVAAGVALAAVVVPAAANPALDRPTNTLVAAYAPVERQAMERLAGQVLANVDRDPITLVYARDDVPFIALREGLALELIDRGFAVRYPPSLRWFADGERLAEPSEADQALVLQIDDGTPQRRPPGRLVAEVDMAPDFDWDAYDELLSRSPGQIPLGDNPLTRAALDALRPAEPRLVSRVADTMPTVDDPAALHRLQVYVLDRAQLATALESGEL